jgi:uncharacterized short protein YbdD (DUF466 family)
MLEDILEEQKEEKQIRQENTKPGKTPHTKETFSRAEIINQQEKRYGTDWRRRCFG